MDALLKNIPKWSILPLSILLPGLGHVILGKEIRGLLFVFWIIILGYITYQISTPGISIFGRLSGGIAVWVLSVLEVRKILISIKK
jgi:hypothetical protein